MHAVNVLCSGVAERCGCTENSRGKLTPSGTADILEEAMLRKRNAVASRYAQVQGAGEGCLLSRLLTYLQRSYLLSENLSTVVFWGRNGSGVAGGSGR